MERLRSHTPCDERMPDGRFYCPYMDMDGSVDCGYWCSQDSDSDYVPELDADDLEEFQSFCNFIDRRTE